MNVQTPARPPALADFAPAANIVPLKPTPEQKAYPPKLAKTLMAITREFGAISKGTHKDDPNGGWNDFHKYGYQKWDDVLERESTLLQKHGIIIQQSEVARSLLDKLISISYEFTIINEDGDCWPDRPIFTAIGRLQDQKGMFDDKAANKCHTQAHKYFLLHTFKIKTKETVEDDADAADAEQVKTALKPPKPGSAEAKALEGPRTINANGHNAKSWADAFMLAIERATPGETSQWIELNKNSLDKLGNYPEIDARVKEAIAERLPVGLKIEAKTAPKPPRPSAPPTANLMPDPATDAAGWIKWLTEKLATFGTYEAGENFWNDTIQALDLPQTTQEDAMGCWQVFEARFEP
jgi:ERF superfamily